MCNGWCCKITEQQDNHQWQLSQRLEHKKVSITARQHPAACMSSSESLGLLCYAFKVCYISPWRYCFSFPRTSCLRNVRSQKDYKGHKVVTFALLKQMDCWHNHLTLWHELMRKQKYKSAWMHCLSCLSLNYIILYHLHGYNLFFSWVLL